MTFTCSVKGYVCIERFGFVFIERFGFQLTMLLYSFSLYFFFSFILKNKTKQNKKNLANGVKSHYDIRKQVVITIIIFFF